MMKATKTWFLIVLLLLLRISAINVYAWPIPDSGQTKCYNNTSEITCPAPGEAFYGQDGNYNINPPSYIKLDATGNTLPADATSWTMIRDNVTGLFWENKTSDGTIHDGSKAFTWCDKNPLTNGGDQGTCGTGTGEASTDTEAFIKALNDANFGGFSDWRLPTVKELAMTARHGRTADIPESFTALFPNTSLSKCNWSSTSNFSYNYAAWCVWFGTGTVPGPPGKTDANAVRAVRGGQSSSLLGHLVINGDGTVTDTDTGLMWQQDTYDIPLDWQGALAYAEGLSLAGYDDWRLPNIKELQSIIDYGRFPAIDTTTFPSLTQPSRHWWQSTSYYPDNAFYMQFISGAVDSAISKLQYNSVLTIRGGQSRRSGHLVIVSPVQSARWIAGSQQLINWDAAGIGGNVKITLSRQGGKDGTFTETIADNIPNNGSYTWIVTAPASVNCVMKIEPLNDITKYTTQGLFSITTYTLTITKSGNGSGSVTTDNGTISWNGNVGTTGYNSNGIYVLTATPSAGCIFAGWSGSGCEGTGQCTVILDADKSVTATFADIFPPAGTITINSGAEHTYSTTVNLTLTCSDSFSGCTQMQFSNDNMDWSTAEDYAPTKSWSLSIGDGTKTAYAKFKDGAGNWSDAVSDTIILDTAAPITTPSISGGTYIGSQTVALAANKSATIYYTLDGSNPTTSSLVYSNPINMTKSTTLKYFARDSAGNESAVQTANFTVTPPEIWGRPIPDTGQTKCYNKTSEITCPQPGQPFYGQDGNYTINPPSYAKLDATGAALPDDATSWAMVRDNVTGLIWENKTTDGSIHDSSKIFTWCNRNTAINGGDQGTCGTGTGNAATDTEAFIKALNDSNFGGFSDWRMPSVKDLGSIVDRGRFNPSINTAWFPGTVSSSYWSSTTYATTSYNAWCVDFDYGPVNYGSKTLAYAVRAVRGGQSGALDHFVINGDGTVTDTDTGLMWQQGTSSPAVMTWEVALTYAEGLTLAGYDDWRLPTLTELDSIVDYNHYNPAIDTAMFPGTVSSYYWSSTTHASYTYAWCVTFGSGYVSYDLSRSSAYAVRAVRGGQSGSFGNLVIFAPAQADRWHIGEQKTIAWDTAGISGNVKISLSRQGGKAGTFTEIIAENVPNNGIYAWKVSGPETFNAMLKIEPLTNPTKGTTQGLFTITTLLNAWVSSEKQEDLGHYRLTLYGQYSDGVYPLQAAWSSSDTSVATVSGNLLTALKNGYVEISATYGDKTYSKGIFVYTSGYMLESESNNTKQTASPMTEGTFYKGGFYTGDIDYYRFTLPSASIVNIGYLSQSITADMKVEIYDNAGNLLSSGTSTNGGSLNLPLGLVAGTYYIKVTSTGDVDQSSNYFVVYKVLNSLPEKTAIPISFGETKESVLYTLRDQADFNFTLPQEQEIRILFTPSGGTARYHVALLNTSQIVIDQVECLEQRPVTLLGYYDGGSYTLRITPRDFVDASSTFSVALSESTDQLEKEPNDAASQAAPFNLSQPIIGRLNTGADVDFYTFQLDAPRYLELTFTAPGSTGNYSLTLYKESDQNEIDGIEIANGRTTSLHMGLGIGRYYLRVKGGASNIDTLHNYTLTINDSSQTDLEIESNNTLRFANAIENNVSKKGRIYSAQDRDYYGFYLPDTNTFTVTFTPATTTGDYRISLVDENDQMFDQRTSSNGESVILESYKASGNYYIRIELEPSGNIDQYNTYVIRVTSDAQIAGLKQMVSVTLSGTQSQMTIGGTQTLTAAASYSDATTAAISPLWTSLNPAVATVDAIGVVTAVSQGSTSVIVSYGDLTARYDITVGAPQNVVAQHYGNLILVAGGGIEDTNTLKESTQYLADLIYRRFKARLFTDEDIYYFNPLLWHDLNGDGFGENIVDDASPTVVKFGNAITQWAASRDTDGPLYVYLIDHGGIDNFMVYPDEIITADQLKEYLDAFQTATGRKVVVIIEACKSGSFVDNLLATTHNRIVVTSADDGDSYMQLNGEISFSQFFVDRLLTGDSINQAYLNAIAQLAEMGLPYTAMSPQLGESTAQSAAATILGGDFAIASLFPQIAETSPNMSIQANTVQNFFARLSSLEGIASVWAVVLPPDYVPPSTTAGLNAPQVTLPTFALTDPDKDRKYEGSYNEFIYNGEYRIRFYARNVNGNVTVSPPTVVTVTGGQTINYPPGDINRDKVVNLADAILVLQAISWLKPAATIFKSADVNNDGRIGLQEAIYILQKVAGVR